MTGFAVVEYTVFLCSFAVQLFLNCWLDGTRSGCRYTPRAHVTTLQLALEHLTLFKQNVKSPLCSCSGELWRGGVFIYARLTWGMEPPDLPRAYHSAGPLPRISPVTTGAGQWSMPVNMNLCFFYSVLFVLPPKCFSANKSGSLTTVFHKVGLVTLSHNT